MSVDITLYTTLQNEIKAQMPAVLRDKSRIPSTYHDEITAINKSTFGSLTSADFLDSFMSDLERPIQTISRALAVAKGLTVPMPSGQRQPVPIKSKDAAGTIKGVGNLAAIVKIYADTVEALGK